MQDELDESKGLQGSSNIPFKGKKLAAEGWEDDRTQVLLNSFSIAENHLCLYQWVRGI